MKKRVIVFLILGIFFIGGIIYFAFSSDKSISITYIKFKINPSFIIGLDDNDVVKIYNPLNDDAKLFNLTMFNNKSVDTAMEIVLKKLDQNQYLTEKQIDITVITKNPEKIDYYYNKLATVIKNYDAEIVLYQKEASYDELYAYSNEVTHDIGNSLTTDNLISVANAINEEITNYVNEKIGQLDLDKLDNIQKLATMNEQNNDGYFSDYDLINYISDEFHIVMKENSNYAITFNEDLSFTIRTNLDFDFLHEIKLNEQTYNVIEEYIYTYDNNEISGLKVNCYKY